MVRFARRGGPVAQAASDDLLGPHDPVPRPAWVASGGTRLVMQPGFAAIVGELDADASRDAALESIRLLMLTLDFALHPGTTSAELGAGVVRHTASFGPVAVTPDELGGAWQGGQVHLGLESIRRRHEAADEGASVIQPTDLGTWVAQAARGRRLRAGTIVLAPSDNTQTGDDAPGAVGHRRAVADGAGRRRARLVRRDRPVGGRDRRRAHRAVRATT